MCIPRKINFLLLGRYGRHKEQRYCQTFRKDFDWMCFNKNLAADRFQYGMKRAAITIDPSYISKAGKKTDHIGRFWSGCGIYPNKTLNAKLVKELFGLTADAA